LSVSASDTGGVIRSFLWAKDGTDFTDITAAGTFYVSFKDTGVKVVLVKVRDNKALESAIDTFHIGVYDKIYATFYDGNGSTGGTVPIDINRYIQGQNDTVLDNTGSLVKTGFVFSGWNTQVDGRGASYAPGSVFAIDTINVTLYAQWMNVPTFTVTYSGNTSTGGTAPTDIAQYMLGQSVTVLGNTGSLVKAGFTFIGWNTQADGSGITYATGVVFAMGSSNVTLYAQWTANPTYTVTYDGNGGSGNVPADNNNYTAGATVTVLGNTGPLVKTGYTFIGWNTQSNGGGTNYETGVTFTMGSANMTLFAQWTANSTYTVTYNGNTSTGGTVPKDNNNYLSNATVTVLGNTGSLVKTGYTFVGWNTKADGSGTNYAGGAIFQMASVSAVLYAQWTVIPTFTVTYSGNGSTGGTAPTDNNRYTLGQSVTALGNTGTLAKTGFTFIGWNTQANDSGISYATGVTFSMGSSNVTLYAQWTANPTYTVTYNGNGGTGNVPPDNNNYPAGATVTVLGNTGPLVMTGSTFVGWNTQANGGGAGTNYAAGATFSMGSANVILYAQWSASPTYTVTYNGDTSTGGAIPKDGNFYLTGATVTVLGNIGNPVLYKTGYAFSGWNTKADGSGTGYAVGATFQMTSANVTLYAHWVPTFTVTYNANGSTGGAAPADNNSYLTGATVTVLGNIASSPLVKTGNAFAGWNTKADGSGTSYAVGAPFAMGTSNVILYAKWTIVATFTVTYNANGSTGGSVPTDAKLYTFGQSDTVLGNTGSLVKAGFTFVGWNTQPNGSGIGYATGVTFTIVSSNVVLYAQWTALSTYTVTYNGNGGIGAQTDPNQYLAGATVIVRGQGTLQDTGYTFAGWNRAQNGSLKNYAVNDTLIMGAVNVTLFAKWTVFPAPTPAAPAIGATNQSINPALSWSAVSGATSYEVQVSTASSFSTIMKDTTLTTLSLTIGPLTNASTYYWHVRAKNNSGISAWSSIWNFTTANIIPPTVNSTSPVSGATNVSPSASITTTFSKAMNPTTITSSSFTLKQGATAVAGTVTYNATTNIASFKPNTALASSAAYTATISTDVADVAGNHLATAYTWSFTTADVIPPTISLTSPVSGATNVSPSASITAAFSEAMSSTTITATSFTLKQGATAVAGTVTYSATTNIASFKSNTDLASTPTTYTATISTDVTDVAGNHLATAYTWSFTTADVTMPSIKSTSPGSGAINILPTTTVSATFSKAMNANTITATSFTLTPQGGSAVSGSITYSAATNTATFTLAAPLAYNTNYTAMITTGVTDAVGNHLGAEYQWTFTTIVAAPGVPGLNAPVDNATGVSVSPTLSWNAASGAGSITYELQVSISSGFGTRVFDQSGISSISQAISPALSNNTLYYWRVNATNAGGPSGWSGVQSFMTIVAAPTIVVTDSASVSGTVTISGNTVSGAISYNLYYTDGISTSGPISITAPGAPTFSFAVSSLSSSPYTFWVKAVDAFENESVSSGIVTATPL
jgi:Listeria/Bacterioides repeat/Listeria/Bacterioides repeat/Listeria/Bacterioides repeat/Listeria/Bacterioides repeat